MAIVDERGRIFGKVNLIDFAVAVFCLLLVPLGYGAYVMFRNPIPTVVAVSPATLQPGKGQRVKLTGTGFRPFLTATVGPVQETSLLVETATSAEILLPDVGPGTYDLILYEAARELSRKAGAITIVAPPPPLQSLVAVQVSGAFTSVPEETAKTLAAGAKYPAGSAEPAAEIVSLKPAAPEVVYVPGVSGLLEERVPGMVSVPAVLRVRCVAGKGVCKVGEVNVATGALLSLPGLPAPFQVLDVSADDKSHTLDAEPLRQTIEIDARLVTSPETVPLLTTGAVDTDRRLLTGDAPAAGAVLVSFRREADITGTTSLDWSGLDVKSPPQILGVTRPLAILTVTLRVPVERTPSGWLYKTAAVKVGAPFGFDSRLYMLRGWITAVRSQPASAPRTDRAGKH